MRGNIPANNQQPTTNTHTHTHTHKQTNEQTNKQTNKQTNTQTNKQNKRKHNKTKQNKTKQHKTKQTNNKNTTNKDTHTHTRTHTHRDIYMYIYIYIHILPPRPPPPPPPSIYIYIYIHTTPRPPPPPTVKTSPKRPRIPEFQIFWGPEFQNSRIPESGILELGAPENLEFWNWGPKKSGLLEFWSSGISNIRRRQDQHVSRQYKHGCTHASQVFRLWRPLSILIGFLFILIRFQVI